MSNKNILLFVYAKGLHKYMKSLRNDIHNLSDNDHVAK